MRNGIATVSLGGTLREKLVAIADAGFEGIEIFETDIVAHDGPPAEVGRMARDLGLEIIAFQPFRDFEGMPELSASIEVAGREVYYGYPLALLAMVLICLGLYRLFKRSGWL